MDRLEKLQKYLRDLSEEYGKTEPIVSRKSLKALKEYAKGEIPGTMPAEFKKLYLEELPKMMYRQGYAESHPQEALDLAASLLGVGGGFAPLEGKGGEVVLGTIKGLKRGSREAKWI